MEKKQATEKRESDEKLEHARWDLEEQHVEELAQEKLAQAILLA